MNSRLFTFVGGNSGVWRIVRVDTIVGESIPSAAKLDIISDSVSQQSREAKWSFRGITSNERYVHRDEKDQLVAKQPGLGRSEALCAALIPIRKNPSWWGLPQDERRRIFEEQSKHTHLGLQYLPAIARRLHHCRDLGENEPFDFLTWFEFAPSNEAAFNKLVAELRASREWTYVDREIDIRLTREPA
jgi:hypothetical protein